MPFSYHNRYHVLLADLQAWGQRLCCTVFLLLYIKFFLASQSIFFFETDLTTCGSRQIFQWPLWDLNGPNVKVLEYSQSINMSVCFSCGSLQSLNRWVFAYSYRKKIGCQTKYIYLLCLLFQEKILSCRYISIVKTFWILSLQRHVMIV